DVKINDVGNDEPQVSILLYYQNGQLINFGLPVSAIGGTQLTSIIPTGLAAGPVQITTVTFDLESGLISDESAPFTNFSITLGSLRRIDEDEPNDGIETATEVSLQTIVDGQAAKDDPGDLVVLVDNTTETLVDLFHLTLSTPTQFTLTLTFNQTADLDLFLLRQNATGDFDIIASSTKIQGTMEQFGTPPLVGDYYIAVGAFSGSSPYTLEL